MRQLHRTIRRAGALALAALAFGPALAFAQEFQKVEGAPRVEMLASPFVGTAYGFIWIAILVYVFVVARGLARVDRELAELQRKLGRGGAGPSVGPDR